MLIPVGVCAKLLSSGLPPGTLLDRLIDRFLRRMTLPFVMIETIGTGYYAILPFKLTHALAMSRVQEAACFLK